MILVDWPSSFEGIVDARGDGAALEQNKCKIVTSNRIRSKSILKGANPSSDEPRATLFVCLFSTSPLTSPLRRLE